MKEKPTCLLREKLLFFKKNMEAWKESINKINAFGPLLLRKKEVFFFHILTLRKVLFLKKEWVKVLKEPTQDPQLWVLFPYKEKKAESWNIFP